jgi:hypothetical protein
MMLGMMLIVCNGQCPQLFRVYYFRVLCAVTEGASDKKPDFFRMTEPYVPEHVETQTDRLVINNHGEHGPVQEGP